MSWGNWRICAPSRLTTPLTKRFRMNPRAKFAGGAGPDLKEVKYCARRHFIREQRR